MLQKIQSLLLDSIHPEDIETDFSIAFASAVEEFLSGSIHFHMAAAGEPSQEQRSLFEDGMNLRLTQCETIRSFLQDFSGTLDVDERTAEYLSDMDEMLDTLIFSAFDKAEDRVKDYLLKDRKARKALKEDLKNRDILVMDRGSASLSEDLIEEVYREAFDTFDHVREALQARLLDQDPPTLLEAGRAAIASRKATLGLRMDERDFCQEFDQRFQTERLIRVLAKKLYDSFHFHPRYILIPFEDSEENTEEDEPEEDLFFDPEDEESFLRALRKSAAEEMDGVLEKEGDLDPADYDLIAEFIHEYSGRRIVPEEDDWMETAHWVTYEEEFVDLIHDYFVQNLEDTLYFFATQRPFDFKTMAEFLHYDRQYWKDPEVLLMQSEYITLFLMEREEEVFLQFLQQPLREYYELGKALSE